MKAQKARTISVGIVQSDEACRHYLSAVIRGTPGLRLGSTCSTGQEALLRFMEDPLDVALVALFLPDITGPEFIQRLSETLGDSACIVLLPDQPVSPRRGFELLEAGARGYLAQRCTADELVRAIMTVGAGGAVLSSAFATLVADYFRARGATIRALTEREREVLQCLSRGLTHQETADALGISIATVERHIHNLLPKLNVRSAVEAVSLYLNPVRF